MNETAEGACLCGTVRFRVSGRFEKFFLCHCSRCRKNTGSAHAANLFAFEASLDWLSGRESVKTYKLAGTRHEKSFCVECGCPLPSAPNNGAFVVVPAGALDTPVTLRPTAHIHCASRAEWEDALPDTRRMDGLPG